MSYSPSSPLTGAAQTNLTSPTYTLSADSAPSNNGVQFAVTGLGGTQTNVLTTGAATPFTLSFFKPAVLKQKKIDVFGNLVAAPMNVYKQITRKSVKLDGFGNAVRTALITTTIELPAGCEAHDAANVRAALSLHIGALNNQSASIGDAVILGVI